MTTTQQDQSPWLVLLFVVLVAAVAVMLGYLIGTDATRPCPDGMHLSQDQTRCVTGVDN